ncbi:MAG TPA: amidase family protein [Marmoricola sp.]|nr:amidase family protein [Marmoricola sp.]
MQTSQEQVESLLARIAEVDPLTNAVSDLDPTALAQARERDAEAHDGRVRGPLHGRAVLVKDNVDTAGLATTAGSLALVGNPPATDAELVTRLREAGMVVLGKTNLSEWANIRDTSSTSGWSAYGGLTRNPYALNRSACGSSSGSGAAVAARLAPFAVGTETDGSITMPAAFTGCVGVKPTVGTVSTRGVVPISPSQDSPGPMALTVADAAALLTVLSGNGTDYAAHAVPGSLAGKRIGVPRRAWGYSRTADAATEHALSLLSAAGAEIVDGTEIAAMADYDGESELTVLLSELGPALADYLSTRPGAPQTLAEVVEFNRAHADAELRWFGQDLFEMALSLPGLDSEEYAAARSACLAAGRDGIDAVLREHRLDALLAPAAAPAIPIDLVNEEHHWGGCTETSAMAGYPIVTVPTILDHGLPVALCLWGTAGSEPTLLEIAAGYEAARDADSGPLPEPGFPSFV